MLELFTFTVSHFCEKSRWDLDRAGLSYRERVLIPGPHMLTTRRLSKRTTVPLLVHDGHKVQGSVPIHDYIDATVAPGALSRETRDDDAARERELQLDEAIGESARCIAYSSDASSASVTELWSHAGPVWSRAFYRVAFPAVMAVVNKRYGSNQPGKVAQSREQLDRGCDTLDAELRERAYLGGDAPGRLDFAVAALLAPIDFPPEHPAPWATVPRPVRELAARYAGRPVLMHVAKMYRLHRHAGAPYRLARGGEHAPLTGPPTVADENASPQTSTTRA